MCCCGKDLKSNAKNVAIFEMAASATLLVLTIIALMGLYITPEKIGDLPENILNQYINSRWFLLGACIIDFALSLYLYRGVVTEDYGKCRAWVLSRVCCLILVIIEAIVYIAFGAMSVINLAAIILNIFFVIVITNFMKQLKETQNVEMRSQGFDSV